MENRDLKENVSNLNELLKQSEAQRREVHQQQHLKKHAIAKAIAASSQVRDDSCAWDLENFRGHVLTLAWYTMGLSFLLGVY